MQTPPQSTPPYTAPPAGPGPAPAGPYNGPLALQFNTGRKFALLKEKSFLRKDIPDLFPSTGDPAVAVVRENPSDPNVIGLTNCSRSIWTAAMPDGSQRSVDAGKSIKLVPGMVITFGNNNQAQVVPLSSGSAFIAQYGKLMGIGAAALVVVLFFDLLELVADDRGDALGPRQDVEQVCDVVEDLAILGQDLLLLQRGEPLQLHLQDALCLRFGETIAVFVQPELGRQAIGPRTGDIGSRQHLLHQ